MEQILHIVSRGVDKRVIFADNQDHLRFIHNLYEFNNTEPANNMGYAFKKENNIENSDIASRYIKRQRRKLLVDVLAFCLMPNHYHILLTPRSENAVPQFMKKINIGYAKYFNIKY